MQDKFGKMTLACRGFQNNPCARIRAEFRPPTSPPRALDLVQTGYLEKFKLTMAKTTTAANWLNVSDQRVHFLSTARCFPFCQTELADQAAVSVDLALCRFSKHIGHVIIRACHISPDQQRNCLLDICVPKCDSMAMAILCDELSPGFLCVGD